MIGRSAWIPCPNCKQRTKTKVYEDTVLLKLPLFCPKCKKETIAGTITTAPIPVVLIRSWKTR